MKELKERIRMLMTRIAIAESEAWVRRYSDQGATGRKPRTNEIIALANLAGARSHMEAALQHLDGQDRMDRAKASDN